MRCDWSGVFPAMTTQFHENGDLDLEATARHIDRMIGAGVSGLVMLGSLGESNTLDFEEKLEVMRVALSTANGRVPVLSGVSELSTAAACRTARRMEDLGAQGLMVMPAMAYRAEGEEAKNHFLQVARSTGLPIIVYNNPLAYLVDLTPEMFADLASQENLVAIKESSGDTRRFTDLANTVGDRYTLFAGVDDLALECVVLGAKGWIAGIGLAFPEENQRFWEYAVSGNIEAARALYRWYTPVMHLDVGTKFVQNIKLAIQEAGLGSEWVRLPRMPLAGEERERVLGIIRTARERKSLVHG
jgi:4-hydroxy-tetrahydrodipicolinate synthase